MMAGVSQKKLLVGFSKAHGMPMAMHSYTTIADTVYSSFAMRTRMNSLGWDCSRSGNPKGQRADRNAGGPGLISRAREQVPHGGAMCTKAKRG